MRWLLLSLCSTLLAASDLLLNDDAQGRGAQLQHALQALTRGQLAPWQALPNSALLAPLAAPSQAGERVLHWSLLWPALWQRLDSSTRQALEEDSSERLQRGPEAIALVLPPVSAVQAAQFALGQRLRDRAAISSAQALGVEVPADTAPWPALASAWWPPEPLRPTQRPLPWQVTSGYLQRTLCALPRWQIRLPAQYHLWLADAWAAVSSGNLLELWNSDGQVFRHPLPPSVQVLGWRDAVFWLRDRQVLYRLQGNQRDSINVNVPDALLGPPLEDAQGQRLWLTDYALVHEPSGQATRHRLQLSEEAHLERLGERIIIRDGTRAWNVEPLGPAPQAGARSAWFLAAAAAQAWAAFDACGEPQPPEFAAWIQARLQRLGGPPIPEQLLQAAKPAQARRLQALAGWQLPGLAAAPELAPLSLEPRDDLLDDPRHWRHRLLRPQALALPMAWQQGRPEGSVLPGAGHTEVVVRWIDPEGLRWEHTVRLHGVYAGLDLAVQPGWLIAVVGSGQVLLFEAASGRLGPRYAVEAAAAYAQAIRVGPGREPPIAALVPPWNAHRLQRYDARGTHSWALPGSARDLLWQGEYLHVQMANGSTLAFPPQP